MLSLHEILRERRQELGATRAQVSLWSGLPESHIEAIESGERNLTPWEFERISLGLGIDPGSLFSKQEQPPKRSTARFRVATGVDNPASQDLRLLGTASEFGRVLGYLARLLDIQPRLQPLRSVKQAPGWDVWQQGYDLGEQARAAMCDDSGPVLRLEATFSDWQIHVATVRFSSPEIDAASIWEQEAVPIILLNEASSRIQYTPSRRATLAHELCHLLHDADSSEDVVTRVSWRREAEQYEDVVEKRARAFAPAFLAPRKATQSWFHLMPKDQQDNHEQMVCELAHHWGLSVEGAIWHARNCELIGWDEALTLQKRKEQFTGAAPLFAQEEPHSLHLETLAITPDEIPGFVAGWGASLIANAFDKGVISEGRAKELLAWQ